MNQETECAACTEVMSSHVPAPASSACVTTPHTATISATEAALEALLFVSVDPVSAHTLARLLMIDEEQIVALLSQLSQRYLTENRGFVLSEVAGGWQLSTAPAHHELIETYVQSWDTHRLSDAALEVLAVVAYHQPITREGVRAIRGVNSDSVISSLVEKGIIKSVGREKTLGSALLYGTTSIFLNTFGLSSIKDLPDLEQFAPDEASRALIRERLGMQFATTETLDQWSERTDTGADEIGDELDLSDAASCTTDNGADDIAITLDEVDVNNAMSSDEDMAFTSTRHMS